MVIPETHKRRIEKTYFFEGMLHFLEREMIRGSKPFILEINFLEL